MAFDDAWEKVFSSKTWGKYPNEFVISLVARNFFKFTNRSQINVLDLGCGAGANTWFLAREGFNTFAIDGSPSAIRQAEANLQREGYTAHFSTGDFIRLEYDDNFFDCVIDSNAIQHNKLTEIHAIHREILRVLKPSGTFIGIMVNIDTTDTESATKIETRTYRDFKAGLITPGTTVHLFNRDEVINLLNDHYENITIDRTLRTAQNDQHAIGHFLVTCSKKGSR